MGALTKHGLKTLQTPRSSSINCSPQKSSPLQEIFFPKVGDPAVLSVRVQSFTICGRRVCPAYSYKSALVNLPAMILAFIQSLLIPSAGTLSQFNFWKVKLEASLAFVFGMSTKFAMSSSVEYAVILPVASISSGDVSLNSSTSLQMNGRTFSK